MYGKKDNSNIIATFMVIGMFLGVGLIMQAAEPKCIKFDCDNDRAEGSSYCYLHKSYSGSSTYKSNSSSYSGSSSIKSNSSSSSTSNKTTSSNSSTRKSQAIHTIIIHMMKVMTQCTKMMIMTGIDTGKMTIVQVA